MDIIVYLILFILEKVKHFRTKSRNSIIIRDININFYFSDD